jgi:ribulose-phosphate 3-epimerase
MARVAVSILEGTADAYARSLEEIEAFAKQIHVDVVDGVFAENQTLSLAQIYVPNGSELELHLMMQYPESKLETIMSLKPSLVIVHFESPGGIGDVINQLHEADIRTGLAVLPDTKIAQVGDLLTRVDHLLIFTGHLGHYGGEFDGSCMEKIAQAKAINPQLEVSVDGGINPANARIALEAGADELITGSYVHNAESPKAAYDELVRIAGGMA